MNLCSSGAFKGPSEMVNKYWVIYGMALSITTDGPFFYGNLYTSESSIQDKELLTNTIK